jgi:hypothetical protein
MFWYFWPLFPKIGQNFIQFSGRTAFGVCVETNLIFFFSSNFRRKIFHPPFYFPDPMLQNLFNAILFGVVYDTIILVYQFRERVEST